MLSHRDLSDHWVPITPPPHEGQSNDVSKVARVLNTGQTKFYFFRLSFTFQKQSAVCLWYQQAFITTTGNCTFTEFPQPIISVKLSFQQRLQGYISGRRLMSSRGTLVILCLEIMSSIFTPWKFKNKRTLFGMTNSYSPFCMLKAVRAVYSINFRAGRSVPPEKAVDTKPV